MSQVIIYPNDEGWLSIVIPAPECGIPIEEIARKDVPTSKPYHIIDASLLPQDNVFFSAWEADFADPTGHGIGQNAWFIERYEAEIAAINAEQAPAEPQAIVAASKEQAGFPEEFTLKQIDTAYDELLAQVVATNEQNAAAYAQAVASWQASKAARIEQLNNQIATQQAEMSA